MLVNLTLFTLPTPTPNTEIILGSYLSFAFLGTFHLHVVRGAWGAGICGGQRH